MSKKPTIFVHLPAYRDPELVPTIKDALAMAKYPKRIHFGICRQFKEEDGFDNLSIMGAGFISSTLFISSSNTFILFFISSTF